MELELKTVPSTAGSSPAPPTHPRPHRRTAKPIEQHHRVIGAFDPNYVVRTAREQHVLRLLRASLTEIGPYTLEFRSNQLELTVPTAVISAEELDSILASCRDNHYEKLLQDHLFICA